MDIRQANEIIACLPMGRTLFPYYKDRYAAMMLERIVGDGMSIADVKASRFAKLLDRPAMRQILSLKGDGQLAAGDMAAAISSGSFRTRGMVVAPCSMRSLAEIANGTTTTLLTRAADVVLKERRRLVLMVRETPLHSGHLRNMLRLSEMGAVIAPPVPAFYANPETIEDALERLDLAPVVIVEPLQASVQEGQQERAPHDAQGRQREAQCVSPQAGPRVAQQVH